MGMFDHLIPGNEGASAPAEPRSGMFDHLVPGEQGQKAPVSSGRRAGVLGTLADIGHSIEAGGDRAVAGLLGAPADIAGLIATGADYARSFATGRPVEDVRREADARAYVTPQQLERFGGEAIYKGQSRQVYDPETTAGKYARAGAEFGASVATLPLGAAARTLPQAAKAVAAYGVIPGLASEAAGQATEGTSAEPWARLGTALGTGIAAGRVLGPRSVDQALAARVGRMAPDERAAALARFDQVTADAQARGIPLSNANAFDFATEGRSNLSGLQRHVEAMDAGDLREFYARQPAAVDAAARSEFDRIVPVTYDPDSVGPAVGRAAQTAVDQSPQGRALSQAVRDAGPRVTPLQAGEVIQPAQRQLYDEGVQRRADVTAPLYRAAEEAPERIGVDRFIPAERAGEPIVTRPEGRPQFLPDAPRPLDAPTFNRIEGQSEGESLARFIARNGGIDLSGDARAADLQRFNIPGLGTVARENGRGIDNFWREHLVANGYLKPDADGGAARDVTNEVLRLLQNEQRAGQSGARFPIYSERTAGRTAASQADEYRNSLELWAGRLDEDLRNAGVPPDSLHPDVRSRVMGSLMRGESNDPLGAYERVVGSMREPPAPYVRSTTVEEPIYAPRFGQADPQNVIAYIDRQAESAKGPVRDALLAARRNLYGADGETDLTIRGLGGARKAINAQIEGAPREVQSALLNVRDRLDAQLSVAPEYERARSTYETLSRPLDRYNPDQPLGRVVSQDQRTRAFDMRPEQVPSALEGPTAARDLVQTGDMGSRQAYTGQLRTRLLDAATDASGNISAERLRAAIRANEDTLNQVPEVRSQLQSIATAREGRVAAEQSPVGRLARNDLRTREAIETLFPANPLANSERDISRVIGQLSAHNPWAARQLVRIHAETLFNEAAQANIPGPNAMGGAKYAAQLTGNSQQAQNLASAVRALPNGDTLADGFDRFLDVLRATGRRQNVGSRTAYNAEELRDMGLGGKAMAAIKLAGGGFVRLPGKVEQTMERWRLGRNLNQIGRMFSDPDAVPAFRGLLNGTARNRDVSGPVARLVAIANRAAQDSGAPLQLTAQPQGSAQ